MGRNGSNEWKTAPLGDVIELFDSQRVPLNSRERQERKGEYPYYGAQGVIDHIDGYIFDGRYILVAEDGENLNSKKLPLALFATGKFWVNNHAHILRGKPSVADDTFLLACLNNADIKPFVTGAAQPKLSQANMRLIEIPLPPLPVQRQIAGILSTYDELMENSQRRIRFLEAMARALYREWFVHFRFPGHEKHPRVASPLGDIPKGWSMKKLGDTFKTVLGGTPSRVKPEFWEGGTIPWINSGKVNDLRITAPSELITELALERSAAKLMPKGTTVLAITGATLGQVSYLEIETTANQSVVGIVDPSGFYSEWIYLTVTDRIEGIINHASGGAQQHINKEVVNDVLVAPPPAPLAKEFKRLVGPMFREVATLLFKIQNLRRTRDLLLPRLLSGQVQIPNTN